jgi:AraC-like DNA-binding protein
MDRDWTFAVITECQRFVCSVATTSLEEAEAIAQAFVDGLPSPPSAVAELFLRMTLFTLVMRWGWTQHRALRDSCPVTNCFPVALADFAPRWPLEGSPTELFVRHVAAIRRELLDTHHQPLARRAAALLERSFHRPFDADHLARELGAHPTTLRRAFKREWHMSPHEYLMRVRVTHAEDALKHDAAVKIEALALELGWTSKAGLYRAYRQVHGREF